MGDIAFYIKIVKALEAIDAPYMIVGAFAGIAFGIRRVTFDVDILVDLRPEDADALAAYFPLPRYYADPDMMRDSTACGLMFNIIDSSRADKADLIPLSREPEYQVAFARRIRKELADLDGNRFETWCAQPTDIIIGKLRAWTEGRSIKHHSDIFDMLIFSLNNPNAEPINVDEISHEADAMGEETLVLWLNLVSQAQDEARQQNS